MFREYRLYVAAKPEDLRTDEYTATSHCSIARTSAQGSVREDSRTRIHVREYIAPQLKKDSL